MNLAPVAYFFGHLLSAGFPAARPRDKAVRRTVAAMPAAESVFGNLASHATLRIERPYGSSIDCVSGTLWITHDGDPKDVILAAGEHYASHSTAVMLVHAVEDARLVFKSA